MQKIKYFDAHCDTIFKSFLTGDKMRSNTGHIALDRADVFESYAQIFTFFFASEKTPEGGMLGIAKKMYGIFENEMPIL